MCRDPPYVSRYKGSEIVGYRRSDYDEYFLTLKPTKGLVGGKTPDRGERMQGEYTGVAYTAPAGRTSLEVLRNCLKLLVVGHTDSQGSLETNDVLSRHRAQAVAETLAKFAVRYSLQEGLR